MFLTSQKEYIMKNEIETMIFDKLMLDINENKYKINDKLPSENELADIYQVPRIMVRRVYEYLEDRGYIYSKQGKGRYLKEKSYQLELVLMGKESFTKKMMDKGYDIQTRNISFNKIDYDEKIYDNLQVSRDEEVYKVGRLRIFQKKPVAIHISYVTKSVFSDIERSGKGIVSMFEYYNRKGYKSFKSSKSILSISTPTVEERELLECPRLIPLIILESNCIDEETEKLLEYTKIVYRGDCFKYNLCSE